MNTTDTTTTAKLKDAKGHIHFDGDKGWMVGETVIDPNTTTASAQPDNARTMTGLIRTTKGGAITLNEKHGISASYAVATVGDLPPSEIFYAFAKLKGGRRLQFFLNRETGLVVVDVIDKNEKGGREILRHTV